MVDLKVRLGVTLISALSSMASAGKNPVVGDPFFVESMTTSAVRMVPLARVTVFLPSGASVTAARFSRIRSTPSSERRVCALAFTSEGRGSEERTSEREWIRVTEMLG